MRYSVIRTSLFVLAAACLLPSLSAAAYSPGFIKNMGQWPDSILFRADDNGAVLWLTKDGVYYQPGKSPTVNVAEGSPVNEPPATNSLYPFDQPKSVKLVLIKAEYVGANPRAEVIGEGLLDHRCNYFLGNDPNKWQTDVPCYREIIMQDIYPGISLRLRSDEQGRLSSEYIIAAGVDPDQVTVRYAGGGEAAECDNALVRRLAGLLNVNDHGGMASPEALSEIGQDAVSQTRDTRAMDVIFSTFLGGVERDVVSRVACDSAGCTYLAGYTMSAGFPTANPYDGTIADTFDLFVTKLSGDGSSLVYSTFIGGNGVDWLPDITVHSGGTLFLAATTNSTDFPTVSAYDPSYNGNWDVCVLQLSTSGSSLVFSTYLGGSYSDYGRCIALNDLGSIYVAGGTFSLDFPTTSAYDNSHNGQCDGFITKFAAGGWSLFYSTYFGGSEDDEIAELAARGFLVTDTVVVTGYTHSADFPVQSALDGTLGGTSDCFVAKLAAATNLVFSTYIGGSGDEQGIDLVQDGSGNILITGYTWSSDFPTVNAFDDSFNGGFTDAFVLKLTANGAGLSFSTYLGGDNQDMGMGVAVDEDGLIHVTGSTSSSDFPLLGSDTLGGSSDAFVVVLDSPGSSLVRSRLIGGATEDFAYDIAVDDSAAVYVGGYTTSADFPAINAYDGTYANERDGFAMKFRFFDDNDGDGFGPDVDCDDNDPYTYPGAAPQDDPLACMRDVDDDGFGDAFASGDIAPGTDCDDSRADVNIGAMDTPADGIDQDCDGKDYCYRDADDDGFGTYELVSSYNMSCDDAGESWNSDDNCPNVYNPDQVDGDGDGIGDACDQCCVELRGNVDYDPLDVVSLGDLTVMIDYLFVSFNDLECWEEGNVDESQPEGATSISLGDLTVLIDHLFVSFADLPPCP